MSRLWFSTRRTPNQYHFDFKFDGKAKKIRNQFWHWTFRIRSWKCDPWVCAPRTSTELRRWLSVEKVWQSSVGQSDIEWLWLVWHPEKLLKCTFDWFDYFLRDFIHNSQEPCKKLTAKEKCHIDNFNVIRFCRCVCMRPKHFSIPYAEYLTLNWIYRSFSCEQII